MQDREKQELLDNQIKKDIIQLANSKKISDNSYRLIVKKLEQTLAQYIMQIDKKNSKLLNFQQLGRLLSMVGLFELIQYDENNNCAYLESLFWHSALLTTKYYNKKWWPRSSQSRRRT